jgi:hypothetical protein
MSKIFGHLLEAVRIIVGLTFRKLGCVGPHAASFTTSHSTPRIVPLSATLNKLCCAVALLGNATWRLWSDPDRWAGASILRQFSNTATGPKPGVD